MSRKMAGKNAASRKGEVYMKSRINRLSRTLGMVAGALLLLGCGGKIANASKVEKGVEPDLEAAASALAEPSSEAKKAALDEEPTRKIEPAPFQTSAGVKEVIKLAESGVGEEVILAYIENSTVAYQLSVEEILYLNDLGVSVPVIAGMIHHGNVLREKETKVATQESSMETAVAAVKKALAEGPNSQEEGKPQPAARAPLPNAPSAPNELPPVPEYVETPPNSPPPQPAYENAPSEVNYFYNDLSPYGSWMQLPNYGWCWQPSTVIIDRGWRPYCQRGRWLYSDCGWYWHSDYSWGWAPFHYGRWYDHPRCGWVWFPELTWAPAWVSWRYTDTHCGWAPLPPGAFCGRGGLSYNGAWVGLGFDFGLGSLHFNFVSYKDFSHRYPSQHILRGAQAQTVYSHSKVINNIVVGKNNTIINNGVGYERIASASRSEIRKVAIKDLPPTSEKVLKADRVERSGSSLVVYRAPIAKLATENATHLSAARGGQELRKDSTTIPSQPAQKRLEEGRSVSVTTPNSAPKETPRYQTQSAPSPSDQAAMTPRLSKPITERGIQSQANQSAFATTPNGVPQPATTFPSPSSPSVLERRSQAGQTPQYQANQQPQIITPSYRQGVPRSAPAIPNYPNYSRPSNPGGNYAAPAPVMRQPVQPQYNAPTIVQPSYRPAPVQQAPTPRIESPRSSPAYSQPAPQVARPSPPSAPLKRDRDK